MSPNVTRIEECPAIPGMGHLWSIASLRGSRIFRICLWCSQVRDVSTFPDYSGPVLQGNNEVGQMKDGQFTPNQPAEDDV